MLPYVKQTWLEHMCDKIISDFLLKPTSYGRSYDCVT